MSNSMTNKILPPARYITFKNGQGEEIYTIEIPTIVQGDSLTITYDIELEAMPKELT